jgi:hypothetical protein
VSSSSTTPEAGQQPEPLPPERLTEIREWRDELGARKDFANVGPYSAIRDLYAEVERIETEIRAAIDRDREQFPEGPEAQARLGLLTALRIVQGDRFGVPTGGAR